MLPPATKINTKKPSPALKPYTLFIPPVNPLKQV